MNSLQEDSKPIPIGLMGNPSQQPTTNPGGTIRERLRLSNTYPDRLENRRVNYPGPNQYRTPNRSRHKGPTPQTPGYNVSTYNRFSPLRRNNPDTPYHQNRRYAGEDGDFSRGGQRDRSPGRWKARVPDRNFGWRGRNGNRVDIQRGGYYGMMEDFHQEQGRDMNPRNGGNTYQERDMGFPQRNLERGNRQEERGEGRKREEWNTRARNF